MYKLFSLFGSTMTVLIHAYVINMPDRKDRREHMIKLLKRTGFTSYEFVDPVKIDVVPPEWAHMTKGYLSLNKTVRDKIFDKALERDEPYFLVLEDDIMEMVDANKVQERIASTLSSSPSDWDMIYLEHCMEKCSKAQAVAPSLYKAVEPYCTASVIYRTGSIGRLRECFDREKKLIDFSYVQCIRGGRLTAYVVSPPLFAQDAYFNGDLAHTQSPWRMHFWLNMIMRMYPDSKNEHYPRLPACRSFSQLFYYIRWWNVGMLVIVIGLTVWCVLYLWGRGRGRGYAVPVPPASYGPVKTIRRPVRPRRTLQ